MSKDHGVGRLLACLCMTYERHVVHDGFATTLSGGYCFGCSQGKRAAGDFFSGYRRSIFLKRTRTVLIYRVRLTGLIRLCSNPSPEGGCASIIQLIIDTI